MLAIDTETTGLFIHKGCRAFTISAACDQNNSYLWNFNVDPKTRNVIYHTPGAKSNLQDFKDTIKKHELLIFHNANFDIQALDALGVPLEYLFSNHDIHDTMVMSHAFKSDGTHGLKPLGVTLLNYPEDDEKRLEQITKAAQNEAKKLGWTIANYEHPHLIGTEKTVWRSDHWIPAQLAEYLKYSKNHPYRTISNEYAEKDAIRTIGIFYIFQELMGRQQADSYNNARRLIKPILQMQYEKIPLIKEELDKSKEHYSTKKVVQTQKLRLLIKNQNFNPRSHKQLKTLLFDKFKFKSIKEGKSGPSTDKDVITSLLKERPTKGTLPTKYQFLIDLKILRKITATQQYLNNYDIHKDSNYCLQPFFKQWGTGTGRLSCEYPNTTNVGKDDMNNPFSKKDIDLELGDPGEAFKLRNVFGPSKGTHWVCIDYQKFQLLIFAVVSESHELVEAITSGLDPHDLVAKRIFKKDDISSTERTAAKAINFGILFGAGPHKIELLAGMPGLYNLFLQQYPKAKKYLETQSYLARTKGYVHTVGGYRLYVPRAIPYAASCYVIQGTEAEIVRDAMVDVNEYTYNTPKCPYRMIMMVHDELVFRSSQSSPTHLRRLMNLMEQTGHKLGIPCSVDAEIVKHNWAEKEPLDLQRTSA